MNCHDGKKYSLSLNMDSNMNVMYITWFVISSVESQKGAINIQRCSVENQKDAINKQRCFVENQKDAIAVQSL